jgi:RND superfamily putative drug exporter
VESIATFDPSITREQYHLLLANPSLVPPELREALNSFMGPTSTVLRVYTSVDPNSEEARGLVRRIRSYEPGGDLKLYVSGATADLMDAIDVMYSDFPKVIIFVVVAIYLVLLLLFRSVVLPLKAVVMNAMSIFASFGALVYIFQEGHFQGLLGFRAEGFTEASLPILIFCIVFGLSMDYEVFLLSRVKEIYDETDDNTLSVAQGLERTGRIITSAAMIMVLVASSFSTGEIVLIKALGVGIAIAVFLDATLVRALLVPALMRILGAWNWWAPGFLKRVLPQWQVPD